MPIWTRICRPEARAEIANQDVAELTALDLGSAFHQACEVIGDRLLSDRAIHRGDDRIGGFGPAHVAKHHLARKDHGPGVDLVEIRVLGRRAMRRFEDGVAREVIHVAARRDADAAHLRSKRIGEVITVEVHGRDHVEFVGARQDLL